MTVVQQSPSTIVIEPANPQVVYVPEYNPTVIYGTPYYTPGYTAGDVVAAGVIGFGAGIALGDLAGGGCCGWGWNSWNCDWNGGAVVYNHNTFYGNSAWHGGYYNGGYHDGYGYHNAYDRAAVNNFRGSANRVNNFNREADRNLTANRANAWSHDESAFGRSNAFSGLGDRFGGLGGWESRANSFRGWGSMRAGGFWRWTVRRRRFRRGRLPRWRFPRRWVPTLDGRNGRISMSHLLSNRKILLFALLVLAASCNKAGNSPAETYGSGKDGSQDFRNAVRGRRGAAGRR